MLLLKHIPEGHDMFLRKQASPLRWKGERTKTNSWLAIIIHPGIKMHVCWLAVLCSSKFKNTVDRTDNEVNVSWQLESIIFKVCVWLKLTQKGHFIRKLTQFIINLIIRRSSKKHGSHQQGSCAFCLPIDLFLEAGSSKLAWFHIVSPNYNVECRTELKGGNEWGL